MSEEPTKQAAVEVTDAQAKPAAEVANARDDDGDISQLLSNFDEETKGKAVTPTPGQAPAAVSDPVKQLAEKYESLERSFFQERAKKDLDELVEKIRGDTQFSPRMVRGWLEVLAQENPKLGQEYFDPMATPQKRAKIAERLVKDFKKENVRPDPEATETREIVAAAVRGTSTKAPEGKAPNYGKLSNNEFREKVMQEHGFDPGV